MPLNANLTRNSKTVVVGHVCQLAGYTEEVEEAVSGEYAANTFLTEYDDVQYLTVESSNLPL